MQRENHLPCWLHCNDVRISQSFSNANKHLNKLQHMIQLLDDNELPESGALSKAAHKISALMKKLHYRLFRGMVYAKPEEGEYTFFLANIFLSSFFRFFGTISNNYFLDFNKIFIVSLFIKPFVVDLF